MIVKNIEISQIRPNSFNPNQMSAGTFKKLKDSIEKFDLFNPIIVRYTDKGGEEAPYEIIDGEWRYRAFKELGRKTISAREIEATDDEVKQIVFASTIKGKHDALASQEVLKGFLKDSSNKTLSACNLDKMKLERKTKYANFSKGTPIQKGKKVLADESMTCETLDKYQIILSLVCTKEEYEFIVDRLQKIDKSNTKALIKLLSK